MTAPSYDLEFVCESCGADLKRLMLHTCEDRWLQPCGPAFETRKHTIGNADHYWSQPHNCLRPTEDACWVCNEGQAPSYSRPTCCR